MKGLAMLCSYTAKYARIAAGYMGQLKEVPCGNALIEQMPVDLDHVCQPA
jgi:hypothetical protein